MSKEDKKLVKDVVAKARDQGWRVRPTRDGLMFLPARGWESPVVWHGSESDIRAFRNFLADMRKRGFRP